MNETWIFDRSFWSHRPVAVTGATGFLGSHIVDLLVNAGAQVVVLVRDSVPPTEVVKRWAGKTAAVYGSVEDVAVVGRMLGEYDVRTVFHLAAQTQVEVANRNPLTTFESNIAGTWSVLEASRRSPLIEQVIVASSDKAYGSQVRLPYAEDMDLRPVNPYDVSKACADLLAQSYARTMGVPAVVTRCGNFFGPGDTNWKRLVPGTIRQLLEADRPVIRSNGTPVRDYLYVLDGALCYLSLAEALAKRPELAGEAFNFSTEEPLSVLELVAMIQAAVGTDLEPVILDSATNEIPHQALSAAKARSVLGWRPAYSMVEALAATVAWYRLELGA